MKIALVANTDWYLYNYKLAFVDELVEKGHQITLISPPGVHHRFFDKKNLRWISFPFPRGSINPLLELATVLRLILLYQVEKFDLVHHFTIKPVLYGSIAAKLVRLARVVNSITGLGHVFSDSSVRKRLMQTALTLLLRFALKNTQVIFQNPEQMALFISKRIVLRERSTLILGSGVDPIRFAYTPEPGGVPVVLMASRLIWEKGVREFVGVAAKLKKSGKVSARYVIVGAPDPGNPSSVPESLLERWQLEGLVEWWGWRPDVYEALRQANIVCLPTFYGEGLPRVLLEASSVGRAIVATDIPGCRQIVSHQVNGLLVPPNDEDALARAIEALLLSPGLRVKMGQAGRKKVLEQFSLDLINNQTMALYSEQ